MNNKFYLTTTLPYVNADPHIGHALEFVQADAYSRYFRQKLGEENVFFNLGTDEHGLKMLQKAKAEGLEIDEFVDKYAQRFKDFCKLFFVSYDFFYQTSKDYHIKPAQEFWLRCLKNGDIYKGKYEGYYCVGCEYYKTEKELVNGKCPIHDTEPIWLSEENYFFRLSKYADALLKFFEENPDFVVPHSKLGEARNFINKGLNDISISRSKDKLPWGIEVPNDPEHVMYVWFDALTNYANAVGFGTDEKKFNEWWPVTQLCGPDNLRFQAIIWQGMLASAGLPFSKRILVHSTILGNDGRKMSKTLGNVVSPFAQAEKYGPEIVRYYLLAGLPTYTDASYKEEDLESLYNANLANNYGNLINRVVVLSKNKGVDINDLSNISEEFKNKIDGDVKKTQEHFENFNIYEAALAINDMLSFGNKYINDERPWENQDAKEVLTNLSYLLKEATKLYIPIIPESAKKAEEAINKQESIILFKKIEK